MSDELNRLDELIVAYLTGVIGPDDLAELERMLVQDEGARVRFARLAGQETDIHETLISHARQAEPVPAPVRGGGFWSLFTRVAVPLAAAALVVVAIGVWKFGWGKAGLPGVNVAKIQYASAGVVVTCSGQTVAAMVGQVLDAGNKIRTGKGQTAVVVFEGEATRIEIGEQSDFSLVAGKGKQMNLAAGKLAATVARQPEGMPLIVTTPHAEATVAGTAFDLQAMSKQSRLDVREGLVQFAFIDDKESVDVNGGEYAVADASAGTMEQYGEVLFKDDFENGSGNWSVYVQNTDTSSFDAATSDLRPGNAAERECAKIVEVTHDGVRRKCLELDATKIPNLYINLTCRKRFKETGYVVSADILTRLPGYKSRDIAMDFGFVMDAELTNRIARIGRSIQMVPDKWQKWVNSGLQSKGTDGNTVIDSTITRNGLLTSDMTTYLNVSGTADCSLRVACLNSKVTVSNLEVRRLVRKARTK
ncbi:MAG: hypothetical protein C0404_11135 [Verrucomicrobia bacterium]|nr:hypothetical protein [Verrucomicrobiota bacterium]